MSKKQIEEMAKVLIDYTKKKNIMASHIILEDYAEELYNAGYRKATDVAEEIFAEIEKKIASMEYKVRTSRKTVKVEELIDQMNWLLHKVVPEEIAKLKKKHTEDTNPTLDAVAVVRCKDCKCYEKGSNDSEGWEYCGRTGVNCNADDYCSYGERREQ